ncbi:MAG: hypothetical protein AAGE99_03255 [Chlamydiota bacterium]
MSAAVESDQTSSSTTEESRLQWGAEVPEELREEASSVSNLAFDLFQKLERHPDVYVPYDKNEMKDWCRFFWTNEQRHFGTIFLNRGIKIKKGKKEEFAHISLRIFYDRHLPKSSAVSRIIFTRGKIATEEGITGNEWVTMPIELRKKTNNLINASLLFFKKLMQHPHVIIRDGGYPVSDWERFNRYDKEGDFYSSIAFSYEGSRYSESQKMSFQLKQPLAAS